MSLLNRFANFISSIVDWQLIKIPTKSNGLKSFSSIIIRKNTLTLMFANERFSGTSSENVYKNNWKSTKIKQLGKWMRKYMNFFFKQKCPKNFCSDGNKITSCGWKRPFGKCHEHLTHKNTCKYPSWVSIYCCVFLLCSIIFYRFLVVTR